MKTSFPLLLALFITTPAMAELYQWKDENGRVHFSDKKPGNNASAVSALKQPDAQRPSGHNAEDTPATNTTASPEARSQRMLQVMKQERELREQEQKTAEKNRQDREARCASLRSRLNSMDGRRMYRRATEEEGGGIHFIDDKERAELEQRIKTEIAEKCQ